MTSLTINFVTKFFYTKYVIHATDNASTKNKSVLINTIKHNPKLSCRIEHIDPPPKIQKI